MSRKRNPVVTVLEYFEHTELALAQQALYLAQSIVHRRQRGGTGERPAPATRLHRKKAPATDAPAPTP